MFKTAEALNFIEQTTGVISTTVFAHRPKQKTTFPAVMSRHVVGMGGGPIPSQYYGKCVVIE